MFRVAEMTSSSATLSISSNESCELSSIGSCSNPDIQNSINLHPFVYSQAGWNVPGGLNSLDIQSTGEGLQGFLRTSSRAEGGPLHCARVPGSQEFTCIRQGNSGTQGFGTYFHHAAGTNGGGDLQVVFAIALCYTITLFHVDLLSVSKCRASCGYLWGTISCRDVPDYTSSRS